MSAGSSALIAPLAAVLLCLATSAHAEGPVAKAEPPGEPAAAAEAPAEAADAPASKAWETAPHEHRGGFAIGLGLGGGVGASNGFPADAKKIGRIDDYTESGLGFAGASGLWIGGALADWLTFGLGGGFSTILNADTRSPAPILMFHTDVYPLYALGGPLRDLGVVADFGLGFPTTVATEGDALLIDGAGASFLFAGAFWEGISAWKMRFGPQLGGHYMWSETIRRPALILGFRGTLYTDP